MAEYSSGASLTARKKVLSMNPQTQPLEMVTNMETATSETATLVQCGFTSDEIASLLWLRQWYQSGGSDRVEILRRLEFLKLLVVSGKLEL
jgi:hypothetical protein